MINYNNEKNYQTRENKKQNSSNRTIPQVYINTKELELYLTKFMQEFQTIERPINEYIGLVMLRLGFTPEDYIELTNFDLRDNTKYFQCIVNDTTYFEIKFTNINNPKSNTQITLVNFNEETIYECIPITRSELGIKITPIIKKIKYADGITYTRYLSTEKALFEINNQDDTLQLQISKPIDLDLPIFDEQGHYSQYRPQNEENLAKYLTNLYQYDDIIRIYEYIRRISLPNNLSTYPEISLKLTKNSKITNLIHLKYGHLENFAITLPDNKTLFLNSDDSWTYEITNPENTYTFTMTKNGNQTAYNLSVKNGTNPLQIQKLIQNDISLISKNIDATKKLVKKKFRSSNN